MKQYQLTIILDEKGVGVREHADPLNIEDLRKISSVLSEYEVRIISAIIGMQNEVDLKSQTKQ